MPRHIDIIAKLPTSKLEAMLDTPQGDDVIAAIEDELDRRSFDDSDPSYHPEENV